MDTPGLRIVSNFVFCFPPRSRLIGVWSSVRLALGDQQLFLTTRRYQIGGALAQGRKHRWYESLEPVFCPQESRKEEKARGVNARSAHYTFSRDLYLAVVCTFNAHVLFHISYASKHTCFDLWTLLVRTDGATT